MRRIRLAAPVLVIYWLMLVGGLALYTAIRIDDASAMIPLWIGAVSGTALGHALALRNVRMWAALGLFLTVLLWFAPLLPAGLYPTHLSMAFLPAAICALWSLSDRASLAAFWFPAMIWMLSILDRADGSTVPDRSGALLIAAVAALFIVFLRARETRRVGLWKTIATTPVAISGSPILLKQPAGHQVARVGWGLAVSMLAFAITAWLAPQLWQNESFQSDPIAIPNVANNELGLPCCPLADDIEPERARVKEYFDIGRGHDHVTKPPREAFECQACDDNGMPFAAPYDEVAGVGAGTYVGAIGTNAVPDDPMAAQPGTWGRGEPNIAPGRIAENARTVPAAPTAPLAPSPTPLAQDLYPDPHPAPAAPTPQLSASDPPPVVADPPQAKPAAIEPAPAAPATLPPVAAAPRPSGHGPRPAAIDRSRMPLHWAALLVLGAVIFQLLRISLRPLRRAIAVRHLRRPFWDETIDQRVSNSWQLALVGLRDAGWRASSTEAPREFARRAGVEGVETCAAILERARHGIAIDVDDLAEMTASADTAYRSARTGIGPVTRVVAAMRWPLT